MVDSVDQAEVVETDLIEENVTQRRVAIVVSDSIPPVLLPIGVSCQFVEKPHSHPAPNVQQWMVGIYSDRGLSMPVFDMECWLEGKLRALNGFALISSEKMRLALVCTTHPFIVQVQGMSVHALEKAQSQMPTKLQGFLGAGGEDGLVNYLEFDVIRWAQTIVQAIARIS